MASAPIIPPSEADSLPRTRRPRYPIDALADRLRDEAVAAEWSEGFDAREFAFWMVVVPLLVIGGGVGSAFLWGVLRSLLG